MEMEEIHRHSCKRSRTNASAAAKVARHQDDEDDDGEQKIGGRGGGGPRLRPWQHPSSRIFRVSRASGGKDRHSKVLTAKGLRDRRVRLSVSTAIQFYDLQDRLGYDQPSKAIEWLIKAASSSISDLPSLDATFPEPPQHPRAEQEEQIDATEMEQEAEGAQQQHLSMSKSGCSSTSETSKGSVLSLSRSEIRVKARERARERAAKDRDKDDGGVSAAAHNHHGMSPSLNSQSSFTELLTGGGSCGNGAMHGQTSPSSNCVQKQQMHHLPPVTVTADYFGQATAGLFGQPLKHHSSQQQQQQPGFLSQPPFSGGSPVMMPFNITMAGDHPETQQQQHFTLLPDHLVSVASSATGDYSFNLSISPGLTGYNRGTLQSNSPSQLPHHHFQRLAPPVDGSNLFFFGGAGNADNQFSAAATGFDGRPQLCYGDGYRHSDVKGKGKS